MIIYLIMAMTDSGTENRERVATLFETVEVNIITAVGLVPSF